MTLGAIECKFPDAPRCVSCHTRFEARLTCVMPHVDRRKVPRWLEPRASSIAHNISDKYRLAVQYYAENFML